MKGRAQSVESFDAGCLDRAALRPLLERRDAPALLHFSVQLAVFVASAAATVRLGAAGHPAVLLALAVCSVSLLAFFPSLHESGHGTAFRTPVGNQAVAWISAVLMLQAPSFFREFHWEHHRSTQDRERDPEISLAPSLLDPWPSNPWTYLAQACGQGLLLAKLGFTASCALLPERWWLRRLPFFRPAVRGRVARECRISLAVLGLSFGAGLGFVAGFGWLLLTWPLSHLLLGLYLMPEHTGLPHAGSQIHRTRTVVSNRPIRLLMWNMPYHAEHHAYPGVPFHAVPALHRALAPKLEHVARGYGAFHREALGRAMGRIPPLRDAPGKRAGPDPPPIGIDPAE